MIKNYLEFVNKICYKFVIKLLTFSDKWKKTTKEKIVPTQKTAKKVVALRLSPELREHVEGEAKKCGMTMSNFVTHLIILDKKKKN